MSVSSSSSSCLSVSLRSFEDYAKFLSSFKGGSASETAISPTTVFLLHVKYSRSGNDSTSNGGRRVHVVEEPGRSAMYTHRDDTPPSTLTPLFCSPAPYCARITTDFLYKESALQLSTRKNSSNKTEVTFCQDETETRTFQRKYTLKLRKLKRGKILTRQ
jgi:hypothetical protein